MGKENLVDHSIRVDHRTPWLHAIGDAFLQFQHIGMLYVQHKAAILDVET